MAQPVTLHSSYSGMAQDFARDEMPGNTVWNMVDWIPNVLGAPLRKRGGWVVATSAVTSACLIKVMYGLTEQGASQLLAVDSTCGTSGGAKLWKFDETTGAPTLIGSISSACATSAINPVTIGDPVAHGKRWYIPVGWSVSGTTALCTAPIAYDGTSITHVFTRHGVSGGVSGSANGMRFATVYKSRLVCANGPTEPRRVLFSDAGVTKEVRFNTEDAWIDVPMHINGLAAMPNVLLVFGADRLIRIRGASPPPESDMTLDYLGDQGCFDGRSIATWGSKCLWANTNGIHFTDGSDVLDFTAQAGMSLYYRSLVAGMDSTWTLRAVVFRGYYILSIANGSGTFVDCLVCDLRARAIFRWSNFQFSHFIVGTGSGTQQLYAIKPGSGRIYRCTDVFLPTSSNKADGDGTSVLPVIEYPNRKGWQRFQRKWTPASGLTHFRGIYLTYDIRDSGSDNPRLNAHYILNPAASSYTAFANSYTETTDQQRQPMFFGAAGERGGWTAPSLGIKIVQTNPSSDTRIYSLEADMEAIEGSRIFFNVP